MRIPRVGYLFVIAAAITLFAPAATPAATPAAGASYKVMLSPEYATASQQTTLRVTVVNTSTSPTTLGSVKLTPPTGFTPPQPAPGTPLRSKIKVQYRTLTLQRISLKPGKQAQIWITSTAPRKCGRTALRWTSQGFQGTTGSGPQVALDTAASSLGVTVLCPAAALCGDGGPPCSTSLVTSSSTYAVVSNAASGTLRQTVNVGSNLTCGRYQFRDPNWYDSVVVPPSSAPPPTTPTTPVVDVVSYKIKNAKPQGIGFCLGAAYDFTTASGHRARATKLPTGAPGFVGLLPRCTYGKPPCISSVTKKPGAAGQSNPDVVMKIQIPESGDPWGHA